MAAGEPTLENTPTWVVALVCSVILIISVSLERFLHYTELMLLGFISLLLTVFQDRIVKICLTEEMASQWLPCMNISESGRVLLSKESSEHCFSEGTVPLLSKTPLHHLHIFIFVLACIHVACCALTILFAGAKVRQWNTWEDSIWKVECNPEEAKIIPAHEHDFINKYYQGIRKHSAFLRWLHSFFKQFYASVSKTDYITLRTGFIMTHCEGNSKFDFHKYIMSTLESEFKKVVGISWYLWSFLVIFLLVNIDDLNALFWIAFIPFILLLIVGTKLELVITQVAPQVEYGFGSCMTGEIQFVIPRLVVGVFVQLVCSYSTLPLYVIVTQMGNSVNKKVFDENVQEGLASWARQEKINVRKATTGSSQVGYEEDSAVACSVGETKTEGTSERAQSSGDYA